MEYWEKHRLEIKGVSIYRRLSGKSCNYNALFPLSPLSFFHLSSPLKAFDIKYSRQNGLDTEASFYHKMSARYFRLIFFPFSYLLVHFASHYFIPILSKRTDLSHIEGRYSVIPSLSVAILKFDTIRSVRLTHAFFPRRYFSYNFKVFLLSSLRFQDTHLE